MTARAIQLAGGLAIHVDADGDDWIFRTVGMAAVAMPVPDATFPAHVELMMCVPGALGDAIWPVRWLETIARIALDQHGWVGRGHTFANGEPPQPLAPDTELCAIMLVTPTSADDADSLLALMLLYREELALARSSGPAALVARLDEADLDDAVDLTRANVGIVKFRPAKHR